MDPDFPKKLGPYIIEDMIGRGGMGTVYRGTDPETAESAAIKVLAPHLAPDQTFLNRFEEEVETLLELSHPNIVQLVSFGKQDEHFFFAMELVTGESLHTILKKGKVYGWAETIEIIIDVCAGLHHSHNLGIIHRDIKPGNIIIAENGKVKVADFGIAKRFNANHSTQYGVVGTAEFMSPEQARGQTVTVQSDLYSLGAVMFMMLTGRPPIEGSTPQETLKILVTQGAPPISQRAPSVPEQLAYIVDRLLTKDPSKRFRSAKSVESKLRDLLSDLQRGAEHETAVVSIPESFTGSGKFPSTDPQKQPEATVAQSGQATFLENQSSAGNASQPESSAGNFEDTECNTDSPFASLSKEGKVIRENDYFQRAAPGQFERETETHSSRLITAILAIGFLIVFSVSAYLVWDRAIREKTADELWLRIEVSKSKPQRVMKELDEFIKRFDSDIRITEAEQLKEKGVAYQYRNRISLKRSAGSQISDFERKFLEFTQRQREEAGALKQQIQSLESLINLLGAQRGKEEDKEGHNECMAAAKAFLSMYTRRYDKIVSSSRKRLKKLIKESEILKTKNPEEFKRLLRSIIQFYSEQEGTEDLVQEVKKRLLKEPESEPGSL